MNWFYLVCGAIFTGMGIVLTAAPGVGKRIVQYVVDKQWQILPGTIEIGIALGTLYFRNQTRLRWFAYLVGLLLFIDGILYMLSARRLSELGEFILTLEEKAWRSYGGLILILALGYLLAALR